jgi:hypothetical protein
VGAGTADEEMESMKNTTRGVGALAMISGLALIGCSSGQPVDMLASTSGATEATDPGGLAASPEAASAAAASAADTVVALWRMDESGGSVMVDSAAPADNGDIGPGVRPGGGVYEFTGWADAVSADGRLQGSIPANASIVTVRDPTPRLVPQDGTLRVDARLRSRLTSRGLPNEAVNGPKPSFNIVQHGLAEDPGGFWKMEIVGYGNREGDVRCVVSDGRKTYKATAPKGIDDGRWHDAACELSGGRLTASVDGSSASVAAPVQTINPRGAQGGIVAVGKKPGSTDPSDAFSGWIDHLVISTG